MSRPPRSTSDWCLANCAGEYYDAVVHLLRGGADIRQVQQCLGHANVETTKVYQRLVPGHLREAYDAAMPVIAIDGAETADQDTTGPFPAEPIH